MSLYWFVHLASDFAKVVSYVRQSRRAPPPAGGSVLLLLQIIILLSFACPKESNQIKGQPQIFFGMSILSAARALQLALRRLSECSNSNAYERPSLRSLQNVHLFPKKIWWRFSPYGDLVWVWISTGLREFPDKAIFFLFAAMGHSKHYCLRRSEVDDEL